MINLIIAYLYKWIELKLEPKFCWRKIFLFLNKILRHQRNKGEITFSIYVIFVKNNKVLAFRFHLILYVLSVI